MAQITRKHFLVLPSYQVRLVGFLLLVLFLATLLHGFFLYRLTAKNVQQGFFSAHNRFRSTWEVLKPAIIVSNGGYFLAISMAFLLITVFLSHRLIGPVVKVTKHVNKLVKGDWSQRALRLRKGDEGALLCEAVNALQKEVGWRFSLLSKLRKELVAKETDRQESVEPQEPLRTDELVARLDAILAGIDLPNEGK